MLAHGRGYCVYFLWHICIHNQTCHSACVFMNADFALPASDRKKAARWLWSLKHFTWARRRLKRTVIIPGHKSCSASEFSLSSFSPPCPVRAIFSFLVQRGSSDVVATWIWGLCHSCRLEQHYSYKLLPQLQNTSCSAGNWQRRVGKSDKSKTCFKV